MREAWPTLDSIGLLILRLGAGGLLLYGHGWQKLVHFGARTATFSDPLGVGSGASLALVVFAEVFCSLLVVVGFLTRLAVVPIFIFTMVAAFVQHAADPWAKKEIALLYAVPCLALLCLGPGRFSVDARLGLRIAGRPRR